MTEEPPTKKNKVGLNDLVLVKSKMFCPFPYQGSVTTAAWGCSKDGIPISLEGGSQERGDETGS